jgi:hypothetical protein
MGTQDRNGIRAWAVAVAAAVTLASSNSRAWPDEHESAHGTTSNPVISWDLNAQTAIWDYAGQQPWEQSRSFAMVHGAIYDAVNAIAGTPYQPYRGAPGASGFESLDAAVATAAYQVLMALFPAQATRLRGQYGDALAALPEGRSKQGGISVGSQAAAAMIEARQNDGAFGPETWAVGPLPGAWQPTPPFFGSGGAWVAHLEPFTISDPSLFRSSGPPALSSRTYAEDLNEVKLIGSASSTVRTPDQTDAAIWWHDRRLVEWQIKRQVALSQRLDTLEAARMFAMVNFAQVDTAISCFMEKDTWSFWRPITAITLADTDGNPATEANPAWTPRLVTPPHPEYTSGHSCATAAAMRTLAFFFGRDDISFSAYSVDSGTTRRFRSFSHAVAEVIEARIWGGIHFRSADVQGAKIGAAVSDYVTRHYFRRLR